MKDAILNVRNWIEKNKAKTIVAIFLLITLVLGVTMAAFFTSSIGNENTLTMGILKVEYSDGETIKSTNSLPLTEEEVEEYASRTSFNVKNTGNVIGYTEISLLVNNLPDALNSNDFRWALYKEGESISSGSFSGVSDKLVLKTGDPISPNSIGVNYEVLIWIRENGGDQSSMLNKTLNAKINVTLTDKVGEYAENGVNTPELADGMIPVVYDEENDYWVKANVRREWYNYTNQKWANAVTVTSVNRDYYLSKDSVGKEVKMEDINSMWVWIPRFKYKISSNIGSSVAVTNPPQIDVVFETGLKSTGVSEPIYRAGIASDGTNTNYYTHPSFRNGAIVYNETAYDTGGWDEELTGFWVGKFETGSTIACTMDTCLDIEPLIKPNIRSMVQQTVNTQFKTALKFAGGTMNETTGKVTFTPNSSNIYGLNTTSNKTNTHMMKNTEWGAVAILSQSQYGKMGNIDYEGANKEVYMNNSTYYTGRSLGTPSPSTANNVRYGIYSYNDITCSTTSEECKGSKVKNAGTGASTTGTIYGIYDMSGSVQELMMANWKEITGNSNLSVFPESKYYDLYTGTSSTSLVLEKAILGDATYETRSWYSDSKISLNDDKPWFIRGGYYNDTIAAGIFASVNHIGNASYATFRTVLIP